MTTTRALFLLALLPCALWACSDDPSPTSNDDNGDVAEDASEDVFEDVAEDVAEDATEDVSQDVAEDTAQDLTEDLTEDVAEDVSEDMAEDAGQDVAEDVGQDVAEDVSDDPDLSDGPDVDEPEVDLPNLCEQDNGGCGEPEFFACAPEGLGVLCAEVDARAYVMRGVGRLVANGSLPSEIVAHGEGSEQLALNDDGRAFAALGRLGRGRVVGLGHEGWMNNPGGFGDMGALLGNAARWVAAKGAPVVGVDPSVRRFADFLATQGIEARVLTPDEAIAQGVDVFAINAWNGYDRATLARLRAWTEGGGGLLMGGHAWYWGYDNDNVTEGHSSNQLADGSGLTWSTETAGFEEVSLPSEGYGPLYHAGLGAEALRAHLLGQGPLGLEQQRLAARSVRRAVELLPLRFEAFYERLAFLEDAGGPVIPTPSDPLVVDEEPIEALLVAVDYRLAQDTPAQALEAHPAAAQFPGAVPLEAPRVSARVEVEASYAGRDGRFGFGNPGADVWRGTGLYAAPGEAVRVTIPEGAVGQGLSVLVGPHTDDNRGKDEWRRHPRVTRAFALDAPEVWVGNAFGGMLYVRVPAGVALGPIEVQLEGAVRAPRFVLGRSDTQTWQQESRYLPAPWAELENDSFIMVVPSSSIRDLDDPQALMEYWQDRLDDAAWLGGEPQVRNRAERFVLDVDISAGYGHSGYPLMAYTPDWDLGLLGTQGDWGAFHELGHNHQNADWVLPGSVECNTNLWSVYLYERVGVPIADAHPAVRPQERAQRIQEYIAGGRNFSRDWSVWTCLESYLQLQAAFGWEFYHDLFAEYLALAEGERPTSDHARIQQWVVRASNHAQRDLGPFFTAWGFPLDPATLAAAAQHPAWAEDPMQGR